MYGVESGTLDVGLDLSKAQDPWEVLAQTLKAEPYLERMQGDFPKAKMVLHYTAPDAAMLPVPGPFFFEGRTMEIVWHGTKEYLDQVTAFEFSTALDAHYVKRPLRSTPCLGRQDWFGTEIRPPSMVIVLSPDSLAAYRQKFDEQIQAFPSIAVAAFPPNVILRTTQDDMTQVFAEIRHADMVCTDHCGIALVASACSVNRVSCLEMRGDPDWLEGVPSIRRFPRRSGPEAVHYELFIDAIQREWAGYQRYPDVMNQGDAKHFIEPLALQYCRGNGIDVGSSRWPFTGAVACDQGNRQEAFARGPFDFLFSSHCLEHIQDWQPELQFWKESLRTDGILFLYLPHPLCEVWKPGGAWVGNGHVHSPDPITLYRYIRFELGMDVLQYSSRPDHAWGFHLVARKK